MTSLIATINAANAADAAEFNGANSVATRDDYINEAREMGSQEGTMANAKHTFCIKLAFAGEQAVLSPDRRASDAEDITRAYFDAKKGTHYTPDGKELSEAVFKKTVSTFRSFIRTGSSGFAEVLQDAESIARKARASGDLKGSMVDALYKVSVEQNKRDVAMTEDDIRGLLIPAVEEKPYSLTEQLNSLIKSCNTAINGTKDGSKAPAEAIDAKAAQSLAEAVAKLTRAMEHAAKAEKVSA